MFLETVRTPGLAHLSYVLGADGRAVVVDPRIDLDVYLELAREHDARIELVFETHRNEDIVSGARALGAVTGARVLHGTALDFAYGVGAENGHTEELGDFSLRVLHTPGHTDESISIAFWDRSFGEGAVGVFTGDALFVGDVGRTDFYPDRAAEVAGRLYDSIHEKLLPLGDQALLYPAHGAGSVCGDGMASREFSSLGHERKNNPRLGLSREAFVRAKLDEHHYKPPYFREMERQNEAGMQPLRALPRPAPVTADELARRLEGDLLLVDVRSPQAQAGVAVPGSLALPLSLLSAYAGWILPYDRPLGLVAERETDAHEAVEALVRMGYSQVELRLSDGVSAWEASGRELWSTPSVSAEALRARLEGGEALTVLDVRKHSEFEAGHVPGARHCYLGELLQHGPPEGLTTPIVTFCGSGRRAMVAASLLHRSGTHAVENCFGSMQAWRSIQAPVEGGS